MLKRMILALLVMSVIFAGAPVQDSALRYFPDSTAMLIEVDLPATLDLLRQLRVEDFAEQMEEKFVQDLLNRIDTIYVGLPEGMDFGGDAVYALMRSNLSVKELIDLAIKYKDDDEHVDIQSTDIGPFTAYYNAAEDEDEENMLITEADGFIIAGSREGLMQYADVRSGKVANAGGNQGLASLRNSLPAGSSVRVYGNAPKKMGSMFQPETIALGIGAIADNLSMHLMLTSADSAGLDKLEQQVSMLSSMAAMIDESGELANLLAGMKVSRENDAISMHLDLPISTLTKIIQSKVGGEGDSDM